MNHSSEKKRPRSVTLVFVGVVFFGMWNAGRAYALWQQSDLLITLGANPDPRFRFVIALFWMGLFGSMAVALWWKRPFTKKTIPIFIALYAIYEGIVSALYAQVPQGSQSWILTILFYIVATLFTYWALNRPATKAYFDR